MKPKNSIVHNEHEMEEFLKQREAFEQSERKNYIANQYRIFSITFGMFLCLAGIVLTTIEPFKAC